MRETQGAFRRQLWRQGILLALRLQRVFMTGISFVEFFTIDLLLLEPPAHSADPLAYASSHQAFLGSLVWLLSKLLKQHVFHLV